MVSPDKSVLISVWLETLFYGAYFVLFVLAVMAVRENPSRAIFGKALLMMTTLMFVISTAHIGVNIKRLIVGFIEKPTKEDSIAYFYDLHEPLNVAKQFLWVINNILADGVLVVRLWGIWKSWVCIPPLVLLIATSGFGLMTASCLIKASIGDNVFMFMKFAAPQFCLSLVDNILVTSLVGGRILFCIRTNRLGHTSDRYKNGLREICILLIETGALYAIAQSVLLSFYVSRFDGLYFVSDTIFQIMAIVPTTIILVVASGKSSAGGLAADEKVAKSDDPIKFASGTMTGPVQLDTIDFPANDDIRSPVESVSSLSELELKFAGSEYVRKTGSKPQLQAEGRAEFGANS